MKQHKRKIGVFIISPNDVKAERDIAKRVCDSFNAIRDLSFRVEPVAWEDYPFRYAKNPQQNIDPYLEQAEIFIVILWYRLGTEVEGCVGAVTGEKNVTGTQYEIEKILSLGKKNLFFYIKNKQEIPLVYDELEEASEQKKKLEHFLAAMHIKPGSTKRSYHTFDTLEAFEKMLKKHLSKALYHITEDKALLLQQRRNSRLMQYMFGLFLLILTGWMLVSLWGKKEITLSSNVSQIAQQSEKSIAGKTHSVKPPTRSHHRDLLQTNSTTASNTLTHSKQTIGYLAVTVKSVYFSGSEITIMVSIASMKSKVGGSVAIYAEGSDNIADFWKFFPRPKSAKLFDSSGHHFRFKHTTMKYAKTYDDWTTIQPGSEQIVEFVFTGANKQDIQMPLTMSVLIKTAMQDRNGKPQISSATLYLDRLYANR